MILLKLIDVCFGVYMIMLFVRIMSSWFPEYRDHNFVRFLAFYTDPYLNIFRKIIPPLGMFDLSPIIAFFALQILEFVAKSVVATLIL